MQTQQIHMQKNLCLISQCDSDLYPPRTRQSESVWQWSPSTQNQTVSVDWLWSPSTQNHTVRVSVAVISIQPEPDSQSRRGNWTCFSSHAAEGVGRWNWPEVSDWLAGRCHFWIDGSRGRNIFHIKLIGTSLNNHKNKEYNLTFCCMRSLL